MRNTKFDKLINEKGDIQKLVDEINNLLQGGNSLQDIADTLKIGKSTLSTGLSQQGYKHDRYTNTYARIEKKGAEDLDLEVYKFFSMGNFNTSRTFRGDKETIEEFETLVQKKFPTIPIAKIYSLAIKEFTEKYK